MAAENTSSNRLQHLPEDILQLIVRQLITTGWVYNEGLLEQDYDGLAFQFERYYRSPRENDQIRFQGLVNWSSTCRAFRTLLAPHVFKVVLLRNRRDSTNSVRALAKTSHWLHVQQLVFVGTCPEDESQYNYWEADPDEEILPSLASAREQKIARRMAGFKEILSNLPPNLTSLSLDFPQSFQEDLFFDTDKPAEYYEDEDNLKQVVKDHEYLAMLHTAFEAVSQNDVSAKPSFEFKMQFIPTLRCLAWEQPAWQKFLNHVTSFTLGLSHHDSYGPWYIEGEIRPNFLRRLPQLFFNHLTSAQTFRFFADEHWPLGLSHLGEDYLSLCLPSFSNTIKHVTLCNMFLCRELIDFLTTHAHTLHTVTLLDCFAHGNHPLDSTPTPTRSPPPTWSNLFDAITRASPPHLTSFSVSVTIDNVDFYIDIRQYDPHYNEYRLVRRALAEQVIMETEAYARGATVEDVRRRRKEVLPYAFLRESYRGEVYHDKVTNVLRFLAGEDEEARLRLMDRVEENIARQ